MKRPEQSLQQMIVRGLRACLPHGWLVHHSANKPRSVVAGAIEKSMGAKKGFPDLIVMGRHARVGEADGPAVYLIEVKAEGGRLSPEQRALHDQLTDLGFPLAVVRSWQDVQETAREWQWPWREAR